MGGVDGQWRQHREDPLGELLGLQRALVVAQLVPPHDDDALVLEGGLDLLLVDRRLHLHQLVGHQADLVEDLARLEPGGRPDRQARGDPALEPGHTDHEELVEVGGEDGQESRALQQRHRLVGRQLQDPLVELQPRDLAVEEPVCGQTAVVLHPGRVHHPHEPAVRGAWLEPVGLGGAGARDGDFLLQGLVGALGGVLAAGGHAHSVILTGVGEQGANTSRPPSCCGSQAWCKCVSQPGCRRRRRARPRGGPALPGGQAPEP